MTDTMIKPHDCFSYLRADEVAECWEGVSDELYRALWRKVVSAMRPLPNMEDNGPHDVIGIENLAAHWSLLSADEQTTLNALVERNIPK